MGQQLPFLNPSSLPGAPAAAFPMVKGAASGIPLAGSLSGLTPNASVNPSEQKSPKFGEGVNTLPITSSVSLPSTTPVNSQHFIPGRAQAKTFPAAVTMPALEGAPNHSGMPPSGAGIANPVGAAGAGAAGAALAGAGFGLPSNASTGIPAGLPAGLGNVPPELIQSMAQMSPKEQMQMLQNTLAQLPPGYMDAMMANMSPQEKMMMQMVMASPTDSAVEKLQGVQNILYEMTGTPVDWAISFPLGITAYWIFDKLTDVDNTFYEKIARWTNTEKLGLDKANQWLVNNVYQKAQSRPWAAEILDIPLVQQTKAQVYQTALEHFDEFRQPSKVHEAFQPYIKEMTELAAAQDEKLFTKAYEVGERFNKAAHHYEWMGGKLKGIEGRIKWIDRLDNGWKWVPFKGWIQGQLEKSAIGQMNHITNATRLADQAGKHSALIHLAGKTQIQTDATGRTLAGLRNEVASATKYMDDLVKPESLRPAQHAIRSVKAWSDRMRHHFASAEVHEAMTHRFSLKNNPIARGFVGFSTIMKSVFGGDMLTTSRPVTEGLEKAAEKGPWEKAKKYLGFGPFMAAVVTFAPSFYNARKAEEGEKTKTFFHHFLGIGFANLVGWEVGKRVLTPIVPKLLGKYAEKNLMKLTFLRFIPLVGPWIMGWTLAGTIIELSSMFIFGELFQRAGEGLSNVVFGTPKKILAERAKQKQEKEQRKQLKDLQNGKIPPGLQPPQGISAAQAATAGKTPSTLNPLQQAQAGMPPVGQNRPGQPSGGGNPGGNPAMAQPAQAQANTAFASQNPYEPPGFYTQNPNLNPMDGKAPLTGGGPSQNPAGANGLAQNSSEPRGPVVHQEIQPLVTGLTLEDIKHNPLQEETQNILHSMDGEFGSYQKADNPWDGSPFMNEVHGGSGH